jgi:hypothetical protein
MTIITLNDLEFMDYVNSMQDMYSLVGFVGSIVAGATTGGIGSGLMGAYAYFSGAEWSNYENTYLHSTNRKGATITKMFFTASMLPCYTAYYVTFND